MLALIAIPFIWHVALVHRRVDAQKMEGVITSVTADELTISPARITGVVIVVLVDVVSTVIGDYRGIAEVARFRSKRKQAESNRHCLNPA